ncbi:hypothetical protein XELAEV_18018726mg [Xenopus laevis]|uniref:G-protein coupled receptors family 1 profile domain-containing protein n=1 Tax=Xenopus laevis TaxID=8355 RepID=A0A974HTX4_XENLA|nr:hypothetical protein XELAEV_18018726mg [Xenopus laevis]
MIAVSANLLITILVFLVPQLQTPMYFFLCNLAILDIFYVSVILPKLLAITITEDQTITFYDCMIQLYCFLWCVTQEVLLLTCMAYDRYVAICMPLRYSQIINKHLCIEMAALSWLLSGINSIFHTIYISHLAFDYSKEIDHFFCDLKALMMISSSDTRTMEMILLAEDIYAGVFPFLCILTSYIYIIATVLKIPSSARLKAFSSCTSHLTVVLMSYGISIFSYAQPISEKSVEQDKLLAIFYAAVVPTLNPLVYSLRNKDVLRAVKKLSR